MPSTTVYILLKIFMSQSAGKCNRCHGAYLSSGWLDGINDDMFCPKCFEDVQTHKMVLA